MALQTKVGRSLPVGVAGDKASLTGHVYTLGNPISETAVTAGNFVWASAREGYATATGTAGVQPLGIVERNHSYQRDFYGLNGGTLEILPGNNLNVVRRGDMMAVSTTEAAKGDAVFASLTGGGISTGAAGGTIAGSEEVTGWVVEKGGAAGDIIFISNWSK